MTSSGPASDVRLRRLTWAGVEMIAGNTRVLIDPLENVTPLAGFLGAPRHPLARIEECPTLETHALVTHLHPDHCDRELLTRIARNGTIGCHAPIVDALAGDGVAATPLRLGEPHRLGPFTATAVVSLDWRGDDQVAWILEADGVRVIHCGDTIWHGSWWKIAREHGPFHVAFLPINGVLTQLEGFTPTSVPATLTPEQAVEAAVVLNASTACAIHHGLFHNPPAYAEQPNARERFLQAGHARGIHASAPHDGMLLATAAPLTNTPTDPRAQPSR